MRKFLAATMAAALAAVTMTGCVQQTTPTQTTAAAESAAESAGAADGIDYPSRTIKISTSGADQGIDALTAKHFESLVEAASGGKIQVEVYPNSQLAGGDMSKLIELLVAGGNYDIVVGSGSVLGNVDEKFLTHTIPFLFNSYDEAASYLDGTGGEYYKKLMEEKNLVYLGAEYNGLRQLTTKDKVIKKPEDLKGLRIRVPSGEVYMKTLTDMGADPVAMNWSEVFTALQQGTLDGHENGYQTIASANIQEVQKNITEWNWSFDGYWMFAGKKAWDSYDDATKKLVEDKAIESCQWGREKLVTDEEQIRKDFQEKDGVTITQLTDEEHQAFVDAAKPAQEYFIDKFGEEACGAWGLTK